MSLTLLETLVGSIEQRLTLIGSQLAAIKLSVVDPDEVAAALAEFEPVWEVLHSQERTRIVHLLIEAAEYSSRSGGLNLVFHVGGAQPIMAEAEDN